MSTAIYITILVLYLVYIFWTWNNTKSFEGNFTRVSYIAIGTLFITFVTYIIFVISKNGVNYPNDEIMGKVRNIILLTFIPVNGFITLPQIGNIITKIRDESIDREKIKMRIIVFLISIVIVAIFECYYFGGMQNRIIEMIRLR